MEGCTVKLRVLCFQDLFVRHRNRLSCSFLTAQSPVDACSLARVVGAINGPVAAAKLWAIFAC